MKKLPIIIVFAITIRPCFAQVLPVTSSNADLVKNHVKSLSVFYQLPDSGKSMLVYKESFDESGNALDKYILSIWNDVSHSRTITFKYNQKDKVEEEVLTDKILDLFPRDQDYIMEFGDKPLYQKTAYAYDSAGILTSKNIFVSGTLDIGPDVSPTQVVTYEWKNGLLISEQSDSPDNNAFSRIYLIMNQYDQSGRLIVKSMTDSKETKAFKTTSYQYDSLGRVEEEIIEDPTMPRNDAHYKYTYDSAGQLIGKYKYSAIIDGFEEINTYAYDDHGNMISGEREVTFTYYENGLIKSERWTDDITDVEILFSTAYEYY